MSMDFFFGFLDVGAGESVSAPLNAALAMGQWEAAERILSEMEQDDPVLNLDHYGRRPLAMVLSCHYSEHMKRGINLKLVKMMVEKGADPNLPIMMIFPNYCLPLTEVIRLYIMISEMCQNGEKSSIPWLFGLSGEENLTAEEAMDDLVSLIEFLLARGADPNGRTMTDNMSILQRVIKEHGSRRSLVKMLCESGGNVNRVDYFGATPVMSLPYICPRDAIHLLEYFWDSQRSPDIHKKDRVGRTTFWLSLMRGCTDLSVRLCEMGTSEETQAQVVTENPLAFMLPETLRISALFAPHLKDSHAYVDFCGFIHNRNRKYSKAAMDLVVTKTVAPMVDAGYLNNRYIQYELQYLLHKTSRFPRLCCPYLDQRQRLVPLMFGATTSGLVQLCVRSIVTQVFFDNPKGVRNVCLMSARPLPPEISNVDHRQKWIAWQMTPSLINVLVRRLNLPLTLRENFEIEAAKCQLSAVLHLYNHLDCCHYTTTGDEEDDNSWQAPPLREYEADLRNNHCCDEYEEDEMDVESESDYEYDNN